MVKMLNVYKCVINAGVIKFYFALKMPVSGSTEKTNSLLKEKAVKVSDEVFRRCGLL
jgi:hypothetical protein